MSTHKSTRVTLVCEHCGVTFFRYPSNIRTGGPQFCSTPCFGSGKKSDLIDRFYRYVGPKRSDGCIYWTGAIGHGYGYLGTSKDRYRAHRLSYRLFVGEIPPGLSVLHRCANRPCINPTHLFIGTAADNTRDMLSKNRHSHGESRPAAKLTEATVREARRRRAAGESAKKIAELFGVSDAAIHSAVKRLTWKHVTDD